MLKIDNTLLQEVGLATLPEAEKNSFLKHIYETLEMRVGIRLADQMSNEQLDEFERYFEAKDDAGAFKWLETSFPNYKDIVQQEFDKLKSEVAQTAPQILAASQAQSVQQPVVDPTAQVQPIQPTVAIPTPPPPVTLTPAFDQAVAPQAAPLATQPQAAVPPAPQSLSQQPQPQFTGQPQPYSNPVMPPPPSVQPPFPAQQPPAGPPTNY